MFFAISKILFFLISPFTWFFILLMLGIYNFKRTVGKRLIIISGILLLFFSNSFIANMAVKWWERPYVTITRQYQYAIVLGGMTKYDTDYNRLQAGLSFDRILQTLQLYKQGYVNKIIITGGSGSLMHPELLETPLLLNTLVNLGFPTTAFITENNSRNTYQNAIFTKVVLDTLPKGNCLLVTSAFHMRRAEACFKKAGFNFTTYPTNSLKLNQITLYDILIPNTEAINNWNILLKEWIGYITYKFAGYL